MEQWSLRFKALAIPALLSLGLLASGCATTRYVNDKVQDVWVKTSDMIRGVSSRVDTVEQDQRVLKAEVSEVRQTAQAALTQSQQLAQADIAPNIAVNHDVRFAFNDSRLMKDSRATLDALAVDLAHRPHAYIQIIGHADAIGPETYNLDLARRRAETVAAYLAQKPTVDRDKLRVLSLGEAVPVAENTTSEGRAHNRRVEVRVYRLSWQSR